VWRGRPSASSGWATTANVDREPSVLTRIQPARRVHSRDGVLNMSSESSKYLKFGSVTVLILCSLGYLAYTGVQDSKSYYVTIKELNGMGNEAYAKRLRVAGSVVPGSIKRNGTRVDFVLKENELMLPVSYTGTEAPPDTFKDDSQALADGSFGHDGVFHAKQLQAKCASKYAPQPGATPAAEPGKSMSQNQASGSSGMAN
jgi:cytochrome c-type biogenesis protein CcmE